MISRILLFVILLTTLLFPIQVIGDDQLQNKKKKLPKNGILIELLGNEGLYSLNYEYIFRTDKKVNHGISIGFSIDPIIDLDQYVNDFRYHNIPLSYLMTYGIDKHFVVCRAILVPSFVTTINPISNSKQNYKPFQIYTYGIEGGYRFQKRGKALSYQAKLGLYPRFYRNLHNEIKPNPILWPALTFGYHF